MELGRVLGRLLDTDRCKASAGKLSSTSSAAVCWIENAYAGAGPVRDENGSI